MVGPFSFTQVQSKYMYRYAHKTLGTTLKTLIYIYIYFTNNEAQFYENFIELP